MTELQVNSICEFKEFYEWILKSKYISIKINCWMAGRANWIVWKWWNFFSLNAMCIIWQQKYLKFTIVPTLQIDSAHCCVAVLSLPAVTPKIYISLSYPVLMQYCHSGKGTTKTDFGRRYPVTQLDRNSTNVKFEQLFKTWLQDWFVFFNSNFINVAHKVKISLRFKKKKNNKWSQHWPLGSQYYLTYLG